MALLLMYSICSGSVKSVVQVIISQSMFVELSSSYTTVVEVLVIIQYSLLVVRSAYTENVVV